MISHTALFLAVTILSNIVLCAYAAIRLPGFNVWVASGWLLKFWAFTLVFGYCYLSLTALMSSLVDSGALALVLLILALIGFGILSFFDAVGFLSPSAYKLGLWSPRILEVAGSLGAFAVFGTMSGLSRPFQKYSDVNTGV
jgi:ABC-type transport system involved in multi-copper enzyme maturation permease subunit